MTKILKLAWIGIQTMFYAITFQPERINDLEEEGILP